MNLHLTDLSWASDSSPPLETQVRVKLKHTLRLFPMLALEASAPSVLQLLLWLLALAPFELEGDLVPWKTLSERTPGLPPSLFRSPRTFLIGLHSTLCFWKHLSEWKPSTRHLEHVWKTRTKQTIEYVTLGSKEVF